MMHNANTAFEMCKYRQQLVRPRRASPPNNTHQLEQLPDSIC